jgi:hypothetical protein
MQPNSLSTTHLCSARRGNRDIQEGSNIHFALAIRKMTRGWMRRGEGWITYDILRHWVWESVSKDWHLCFLPSLRFPTLEHCCTGGEALLPEELEQWRKHTGLLLHEVYGQSETVGSVRKNDLFYQSICYPL